MNLCEETENRYSDDEKILMHMKQTVLDLEKNKIEKEYEYETFEQFWDDNYGEEYGYSDKYPSEPYYSIASYSWEMAENHGYYLGKFFGNLEDEKPRYSVDDDKPIGRPYHDD